jgi:integration host factor subunit beta
VGNITKQDLISDVSKSTGVTQADVKLAVEEFLTAVADTLIKGSNIEIRGFGTFLTKVRKPRPARNPKTGDVVPLKERTVPLFKFSSELKKKINSQSMNGSQKAGSEEKSKESNAPEIY